MITRNLEAAVLRSHFLPVHSFSFSLYGLINKEYDAVRFLYQTYEDSNVALRKTDLVLIVGIKRLDNLLPRIVFAWRLPHRYGTN